MATKYFCDACDKETRNLNDLIKVTRNKRNDGVFTCDLCKSCSDKIFKPVKEWGSTWTVKLEFEEKD